MFKKILKTLGGFILGLILLLVGGMIYAFITTSNDKAEVTPYLKEKMPIVATWKLEKFSPFLTDSAREVFEQERGQKILSAFSKLGEFKSFEEPQFIESKSGVSTERGSYDIVIFSMVGHFENDAAQIIVTLSRESNELLIQHIKVNSDVFLE